MLDNEELLFDTLYEKTKDCGRAQFIKLLMGKERQQTEFTNYLEDEIKRINPNELDIGELNLRSDDIKFTQYLIYKEILQKYNSIIGGSDDNKTDV